MSPKISVLMPVYNCENYVSDAIESILNQTFRNFELIIIDGGSTDSTLEIVHQKRDKRLKIIENEKRKGVTESRNQGLCMATGSLIALQDADDFSHPERLEKQFSRFYRDEKLVVLGTFYTRVSEKGRVMETQRLKERIDFRDFELGMQLCNGSLMFRREIILQEGLYDPFFLQCEDYELGCRLSKKGHCIMNLPEFLYFLREHPNSLSNSKRDEQTLYYALVRELYFGDLKKSQVQSLRSRELAHLALTSKQYHMIMASQYFRSQKYLSGMNEVLTLAWKDPKRIGKLFHTMLRFALARNSVKSKKWENI